MFGEGDGSDLAVHELEIGRVGALCCWEHLQPLTKYAMYSMGEQLHVASWPSFSLYRGLAYALGPELNTAASQIYAAEGQCFVLAPCGVVNEAMVELLCDSDAEPLGETEEGLLLVEVDIGLISLAKAAADPVGHYSRPDVMRLLLNRDPAPRVERLRPGFQVVEEPETEVGRVPITAR